MGTPANIPAPPPGFTPYGASTPNSGTTPPPPPGFVPYTGNQNSPKSDELQVNPNANMFTQAAQAVGGALEGIGEGAFQTAAGASDLLDKATGAQPGAVNQELHTLAGDSDQQHGGAQNLGRGAEGVAELILGDGALQSLPISERLAQAAKVSKAIESSPALERVFQAGMSAIRFGGENAAQTGIKTGGDVDQTVDAGLTGAAGGAVLGAAEPEINSALDAAGNAANSAGNAAGKAVGAVGDATSNAVNAVQRILPARFQQALQNGIRSAMDDVADDMGVDRSTSPSIRDVANDVSQQAQGKAKAAYQALDDATGGKAQRFRDAIKNVQAKLDELNGIQSADDEGAMVERLNDLQDAHDSAMAQAEKAGLPKNLLQQADSDYRRSVSLQQVRNAIRQSTDGLRPEMAEGASRPIPERVNPSKLFSKLNALYDSDQQRLTNALGTKGATKLMQLTNDAASIAKTNAAWRRILPFLVPSGAAGLYELHHFFGE